MEKGRSPLNLRRGDMPSRRVPNRLAPCETWGHAHAHVPDRSLSSSARPQRRGLALDPWRRACSGVWPCQGPPLAAASRRRDAPSL